MRTHMGRGIWEEASGRRNLGGGIWEEASGRRHLGEASGRRHLRGGIWEDWEGSGNALGRALGAQAALEAPGVSGMVYLHKVAPIRSRLQKRKKCSLYDVFLRVPLTKSAAGQRLRDAGSDPGLPDRTGGLYQHRQDPTS